MSGKLAVPKQALEPFVQARAPMAPSFQICEVVPAQFRFSNKPDGFTSYATHFEKMRHYWNQLVGEALALDPFLNARLQQRFGKIRVTTLVSPFAYSDTCSVRSKFMRRRYWLLCAGPGGQDASA